MSVGQQCTPGTASNSATAVLAGTSTPLGGSPTGSVSVTIPADTSLCGTPPVAFTPPQLIEPPTATTTLTATVTQTTTATATTIDVALGGKTPGQATPLPPSAGSGARSTQFAGNALFAAITFFVASFGIAIGALGHSGGRR